MTSHQQRSTNHPTANNRYAYRRDADGPSCTGDSKKKKREKPSPRGCPNIGRSANVMLPLIGRRRRKAAFKSNIAMSCVRNHTQPKNHRLSDVMRNDVRSGCDRRSVRNSLRTSLIAPLCSARRLHTNCVLQIAMVYIRPANNIEHGAEKMNTMWNGNK